MKPTKKLYAKNAYLTEFCAQVLDCQPLPGGHFAVALDRTLFYPEGGGQPADQGALGSARVLDVHERDGVIWHELPSPLGVGETVQGNIDWDRRFDHMQQHTGEHILSGVACSQFGCSNVGFHIGQSTTTVDFDMPLSPANLEELERAANWVVWKNVPVTVETPDETELANLSYRSKKEIDGPVRIVTVGRYDVCACCGTHVDRTGQVGTIKIAAWEHYKGGVRLTLLCGARAARDYAAKCRQLHALSTALSAKPDAVEEAVARLQAENAALRAQRAAVENSLAAYLGRQLAGKDAPLVFEPALTADGARRLAAALCEGGAKAAGVFFGGEGGWNYAVAGGAADARVLTAALHQALGGKGGGKPALCQGAVPADRQAIRAFWAQAL